MRIDSLCRFYKLPGYTGTKTKQGIDGVMEQERAVGKLLGASPQYKVIGDTLTLTAPGHSAKLVRKR